jgi:hypothetical protein
VLPRDLTKFVEADARQLAQAVQRISQFSDECSEAIQFKVDRNLWRFIVVGVALLLLTKC